MFINIYPLMGYDDISCILIYFNHLVVFEEIYLLNHPDGCKLADTFKVTC